jgi:hypothetical protein
VEDLFARATRRSIAQGGWSQSGAHVTPEGCSHLRRFRFATIQLHLQAPILYHVNPRARPLLGCGVIPDAQLHPHHTWLGGKNFIECCGTSVGRRKTCTRSAGGWTVAM